MAEQPNSDAASVGEGERSDFIREIVAADLRSGRHSTVMTRFPPHPNGFLHIGHAFAIHVNFGLAAEIDGGVCNLRFDDTNPESEDPRFIDAIQEDIRWLGLDWGDRLYFASDYFDALFAWALDLIERELAYVDSQTPEEIRSNRGDFYRSGVDSPYRDRSVEESLDLFRRMRAGEFEEGAHVLRAKIDMQSPDLNFRDPLMYRIKHISHHRLGDAWPIYPMYDFSHGLSDAIEGITHSLCSLEFADHRPLYEWFLEACNTEARPQQLEFGRVSLTYTVVSKRWLQQLVEGGHVNGWDDPRMPTLRGMRRRGYPPEAIRRMCHEVGLTRRNSTVDIGLLEHAVRDELNASCKRVMGVLRPLKVVIENLPEDRIEEVDAPYHPADESFGSRKLALTRVVYVERDDFQDDPPRKWHRLGPGREVRLRYACLITCTDVIRDATGEVVELRCQYDPESIGGNAADGRKVRGTLHWVSEDRSIDAEVRLYDRLFAMENPMDEDDFLSALNPESLTVLTGCRVEPGLAGAARGERFQFERQGYFNVDTPRDEGGRLVFNRTVALRDTWAKRAQGSPAKKGR